MAISGFGFACRPHIPLRPQMFHCVRKARYGAVAAVEMLDEREAAVRRTNYSSGREVEGGKKTSTWKKLNSEQLGISTSMISKPTTKVLNVLKKRGYEVYLVGGCVRDLILKRTPKDFDIITSAELKEATSCSAYTSILMLNILCFFCLTFAWFPCFQVVRAFSWCVIVGRRFPICHVHIDDIIVEVSSFSTIGRKFHGHHNYDFWNPADCEQSDFIRWRDCTRRDFTINGLMFDPYARIVYDYIGGLEDIRKAKVRTVIPASNSFQEDCARILRAVRIAARLGFRFSQDTARFIKNLSGSILRLDKSRLMMEMNYMLAYGSAEASLRLLWKFGLLELLLPIQAAYFVQIGFKRRDTRSNMLLSLFSNLDKLLAPDKPCHSSLWVGILAFHKAIWEQPRNPMVVSTFCLAVHNGGDVSEAVKIAKRIRKQHDKSYPELSEADVSPDSRALVNEVIDLAECVKQELSHMTDEYYVSKAMAKYPKAPYSDLVFIPLQLYLKARNMFECVGGQRGYSAKQEGSRRRSSSSSSRRRINHELLSAGSLQEVRHTFARVVFDTVYPLHQSASGSD
ncbi:Poly(A) polymerase I [Linum grandiflorum]